jgi:hypothetical protein
MTERERRAETDRDPDLAPDVNGEEQEEEGTQAQTIADEARDRATSGFDLDESEKVPSGDDSDDVQDLVDHMHQMETSGRIDMDAYRGERNDDEEEGRYGDAAEED